MNDRRQSSKEIDEVFTREKDESGWELDNFLFLLKFHGRQRVRHWAPLQKAGNDRRLTRKGRSNTTGYGFFFSYSRPVISEYTRQVQEAEVLRVPSTDSVSV